MWPAKLDKDPQSPGAQSSPENGLVREFEEIELVEEESFKSPDGKPMIEYGS